MTTCLSLDNINNSSTGRTTELFSGLISYNKIQTQTWTRVVASVCPLKETSYHLASAKASSSMYIHHCLVSWYQHMMGSPLQFTIHETLNLVHIQNLGSFVCEICSAEMKFKLGPNSNPTRNILVLLLSCIASLVIVIITMLFIGYVSCYCMYYVTSTSLNERIVTYFFVDNAMPPKYSGTQNYVHKSNFWTSSNLHTSVYFIDYNTI